MSEPPSSYQHGEVVWVKWSAIWWPGEVYSSSEVPEGLIASPRKQVVAFVKFLQEDAFEIVTNSNNISRYDCDKKMEYIKKGIDKYRTNATMRENFSTSIVKAEQMTGGNVNILNSFDPTGKSKVSSVPASPDTGKKSISLSQASPATTSAKKSTVSTPGTYNSSVKVQNTTSVEQNRPSEKRFTCTLCPFSTDRINLLMMHINGHSREIHSRVSSGSSSMIEMRRPIVPKNTAARKLEVDDGIAEDVRKIKESMKDQQKSASPSPTPAVSGRKSRTPAAPKPEKITPKATKSRASKRGVKAVEEPTPEINQEEEEKPKVNEELKKELLADWMDDDDFAPEKEKTETPKAPIVEEKPKAVEKVSEKSSVPIRNIPKKQRVSEIYIQPEIAAPSVLVEESAEEKAPAIESSRKSQTNQRTGGRRKFNASAASESSHQETKMEIDEDEKLLMATAELLNEIEVPAKSVAESPELEASRARSPSTTFQKSNDIDKRNLPPKERNKRIFRARNKSPEASSPVPVPIPVESPKGPSDELTILESTQVVSVNKNDRQELMLPHKKKQSSRLLQPTVTETVKNQPVVEVLGGRKKKRKSSSEAIASEEKESPIIDVLPQSPLRESTAESEEPTLDTTQNRGQKRHLSNENTSSIDDQIEQPELKKFHKSSTPPEPRTITCGANEAICITSKGTLAVARRDSLKTTQANSVVVTSQVIISEPIASPEVVTTTSKPSTVVSLPQQALKNALKIPKENMEEFKKQGLLTIENNRTKLTPKGLQIFKEYQRDEKSVSNNNPQAVSTSSSATSVVSDTEESVKELSEEPVSQEKIIEEEKPSQIEDKSSQNDLLEAVEEWMDASDSEKDQQNDSSQKLDELKDESSKQENDQNGSEPLVEKEQNSPMDVDDESPKEPVEADPVMPIDDEKNDLEEKEPEEPKNDEPNELDSQNKSETPEPVSPSADSVEAKSEESTKEEEIADESNSAKKPLENGSKEAKDDDPDAANEDANTSSGAGLIALQAENFGGPPNCFYLCRQVDDRYEPVDSQILVLNAQNALVPYEGEVLSDVALASGADHPLVSENLSGYSQLSPNSNIIINTPNGQKVELNYLAILALQESADESGVASMEYAGEQFELNINAILDAIAAQQDNEGSDSVSLIDGAVDGGAALILAEPADLPVDIKHSATQVSETLSKPIMSTAVAPEIATNCPVVTSVAEKNLNIDDSLAAIGVTQSSRANVPKSLELPITVTNPTIADTVNHRKLASQAAAAVISNSGDAVTESFVLQNVDNGSDE